jgi:hypothetical protein
MRNLDDEFIDMEYIKQAWLDREEKNCAWGTFPTISGLARAFWDRAAGPAGWAFSNKRAADDTEEVAPRTPAVNVTAAPSAPADHVVNQPHNLGPLRVALMEKNDWSPELQSDSFVSVDGEILPAFEVRVGADKNLYAKLAADEDEEQNLGNFDEYDFFSSSLLV